MKNSRKDFLKLTGMAGIGLASPGIVHAYAFGRDNKKYRNQVILDRAVATLEDGSELATPFWRIDSGRDGPSLFLIAAQHGNEVQGAEVARRFQEICAMQLVAGSVWLLPMGNLLAIRSRRHSFDLGPEQNNRMSDGLNNMQRHWPGDPRGNDTARVTYALDQAVIRHCSHGVDIHCWEHHRAAETLVYDDHEPSRLMSEVTTTRFVSYSSIPVLQRETMMIRRLLPERGGGAITIELSGQFQMQERQVQLGLRSMINIARRLGMIDGEPELIEGPKIVRSSETSHEIHAPASGIFMPAARDNKTSNLMPEDYVDEGQSLGHIIRESDLATAAITAPVSGYLSQYGSCHWNLCDASLPAQHPYVEEGDIIAQTVKA